MTWEQIRQACRGVPALVWVYRSLRLVTGALILLCIYTASPLARIRIGFLHFDRIGHLAANTEYWLRTKFLKRAPRGVFILLSPTNPANHQLVVMFQRVVRIILNNSLHSIMLAARKQWPELRVWLDLSSVGPSDFALWSNTRTQLIFTAAEMQLGKEILRKIGVPDGSQFVCFAMRDKTYLETKSFAPSWRYHDYRDVDIGQCHLMAEWLASQGIWVLRMGAVVEKSFESDNPRIIDYANHHRSDFGDIFLLGNCKFFVGDTAGIFWPAAILGTPVLLTNLAPITHLIPLADSMVLLKKYRQQQSGELMPYRSVVAAGIDGYVHTQEYETSKVELVENSPEEILGAVQEMNSRIDGTWVSTPADEELHVRFWSVFPKGHPSYGCPARVPIDFLRRNTKLCQ